MLDIPSQPVLDKQKLLGGCVRLSLAIDAAALKAEVHELPAATWESTGGRVGVHSVAQAVFLRGRAPAEGELPVEDREVLEVLPYCRKLITELIPAAPLRCLLARLPAGATIAPHVDRALYFAKSIRMHMPVETNDQVWMYSSGWSYRMREAEIWALNNSTMHGVWNRHEASARTHLICDFLPSPSLLQLIAAGEHDLGIVSDEVNSHLFAAGV